MGVTIHRVAEVVKGPELFVPGLYGAVVVFYADASKTTVVFSADVYAETGTLKAALLSAKVQFAQNMLLIE